MAFSQDEVVGGESGGDRGESGYRRDASEKHLRGFTNLPRKQRELRRQICTTRA
jgi:hypothetical protein